MNRPTYEEAYPVKYDLTNCEEEPIHIIQYVQSHVLLLGITPTDFIITNVSGNVKEIIGAFKKNILGQPLNELLDTATISVLKQRVQKRDFSRLNPIHVTIGKQSFNLIAHVSNDLLILELEERDPVVSSTHFLQALDNTIQSIQQTQSVEELVKIVAIEVKRLTGFDRVMVYEFDEEYNGKVVAEELEEQMEPYLGLHYPASDIPKQARALFLSNKIRLIKDVESAPARIFPSVSPIDNAPIDLSKSVARGVSPIHLEYLSNMGVGASMSVAIHVDQRLWGLISCHHRKPKFVEYRIRDMIRFIGQIMSGHLALQSAQIFRTSTLNSNIIRAKLIEEMIADWDLVKGLTKGAIKITDLNESTGAVVFLENQIHSVGEVPKKVEIKNLIEWLKRENLESYFSTNELSKIYEPAHTFQAIGSGLLVIRISNVAEDYILWFKPEERQSVSWGGKKEKLYKQTEEGMRVSPRKSFAKWEEIVEKRSRPWKDYEIQSALTLRNDIKDFIFQKYNEIRQLNKDLVESYQELERFSYTISHDLRAPLRSIDGFAEILSEDYEEELDEEGKSLLKVIKDNAKKMNQFIDDILMLAKLGKTKPIFNELDLVPIIKEVEQTLRRGEKKDRKIELIIQDDLPKIKADRTLMYQLWQNLLSNAFKYTRQKEVAQISITAKQEGSYIEYAIADNGIGFDEKYASKVFEVFSRLVTEQDFEGTGIGLSIVMKIIQHHDASIDVKSKMGEGTTFFIKFPMKNME